MNEVDTIPVLTELTTELGVSQHILLSTYCVPGTILGAGERAINKAVSSSLQVADKGSG